MYLMTTLKFVVFLVVVNFRCSTSHAPAAAAEDTDAEEATLRSQTDGADQSGPIPFEDRDQDETSNAAQNHFQQNLKIELIQYVKVTGEGKHDGDQGEGQQDDHEVQQDDHHEGLLDDHNEGQRGERYEGLQDDQHEGQQDHQDEEQQDHQDNGQLDDSEI